MSRKSKQNSLPLTPPLDLVLAVLKTGGLSAKQEHDSIVVGHGNLTSRIDVVPPTHRESENIPIRVVVRVRTDLRELGAIFAEKPEMTMAMNGLATLGALTVESGSGRIFVGSRLSIYEDAENLLKLHVGLIVSAAVEATDSLLGAMRCTFTGEGRKREESAWSAEVTTSQRGFIGTKGLIGTKSIPREENVLSTRREPAFYDLDDSSEGFEYLNDSTGSYTVDPGEKSPLIKRTRRAIVSAFWSDDAKKLTSILLDWAKHTDDKQVKDALYALLRECELDLKEA